MSKKNILGLVVFVLFFGARLARAEVIINEVQLNPTEARFIELYNNGNSPVDLTDWYIQRKTSTGVEFGSLVSKTYLAGRSISVGGYFLISKEQLGLNTFTLTESNTIQLKNSEQEIIDKVGWGGAESSVAKNPAEGKSIQRTSSGWVIASPTPGFENTISSTSSNSVEEENNNNTASAGSGSTNSNRTSVNSETVETKKVPAKFEADILAPSMGFVGQPIPFDLLVAFGNRTYAVGKYFWNFGDGSFLEKSGGFEKFTHTYFYPGEYNVSLEYSKSDGSFEPEVKTEFIIKVVPLTVSISKVGDVNDFFVELTNNANYEIDLSKWSLASGQKIFFLPKGTKIAADNSMTIPGKISGFVLGDEKNLKLISSIGEVVFDYNPLPKLKERFTTELDSDSDVISAEEINFKKSTERGNSLGSHLVASALAGEEQDKGPYSSSLVNIVFVLFLMGSGLAVYLIRHKKGVNSSVSNEDFEILDE